MLVVARNILLALLVLITAELSAAGPELDLEVGFTGRFRSGSVSPVTVVVRGSEGAFRGELVVEAVSGTSLERGSRYSLRRKVNLNGGIAGVYRFTLPLEVGSYPLTARLERGGSVVASEEAELRPMITEKPIVVGLSRRPSLDSLFPALAEHFGGSVEMTYPHGDFLPANALAWEGVELVLWHDFSPDFPDGDSARALTSWISAGGTLVVVPGPWMAGTTMPGGLPPGRIGAPVSIDGRILYPHSGDFGPTNPGREDPAVPKDAGMMPEAEVLPFGRGRVIYVPWDAVSPRYPSGERDAFWTRTLADAAGRVRFDPQSLERVLADAAFREEEPLLPAPLVPFAVLLLFAAAAAAILFVGRSPESSRAPKLLPFRLAAILVLSGAVTVWGAMKPRTIPPKELEILYAWNTGDFLSSRILRFVTPAAGAVDIPLDPGSIPLPAEGRDLRISEDAGGSVIEGVETEPWTPTDVTIRRTVPPPVTEGAGGGNAGTLPDPETFLNNGDEAWFDLVAVTLDGAAFFADRLDPGESIRRTDESSSSGFVPDDGIYGRIVEGAVEACRAGTVPGDRLVLARVGLEGGDAFRLIVFPGETP